MAKKSTKGQNLPEINLDTKENRGISLREIAEIYTTSDQMRRVEFSFQRPQQETSLGKLSIEDMKIIKQLTKEELRSLLRQSGSYNLVVLPWVSSKLRNIQISMREQTQNCHIGNTSLMEQRTFSDIYLPFVKKKKKEIQNSIIPYIEEHYEDEIQFFYSTSMKLMEKINPEYKESVIKRIHHISNRSKQSFINEIALGIDTDFEPDICRNKEMKELLMDAKAASLTKTGSTIVSHTITDIWNETTRYLFRIRESEGNLETFIGSRRTLLAAADRILRENVAGISFIEEMAIKMRSLSLIELKDEADWGGMEILAMVYSTAEDLGIDLQLNERKKPEWLTVRKITDFYKELHPQNQKRD